MSDTSRQTGQCLCGAVSIIASQASNKIGACHCDMCRRWGCGPYMSVDCGTDVNFEGEQAIKVFGSSDWAERGFCQECGTGLFYRLKQTGGYFVNAGLFNDFTDAVFDHQVFIDEKPEYYDFANKTHNMTGAELFAQFSGET